jgi:LPXTG-site transpeptidase (sortase) family protein
VSCRTLASKVVAAVALGLALAGPGAAAQQPARLVIPRIGLNVQLAGHLDGGPTVYYRDADTIAIAGHRTTWSHPFNQLVRLRRGDVIRVGAARYRVRRLKIVRPWETWIVNYRGLVLSTCHPAGSDAYRLVAFAAPIEPA